jgi:hypothetical protein
MEDLGGREEKEDGVWKETSSNPPLEFYFTNFTFFL